MSMKNNVRVMRSAFCLVILLSLLIAITISVTGLPLITHAVSRHAQASAKARRSSAAPVPFMHRPYYGNETVLQRTTSFVDHDKPWYADDGVFVRYDGAKWTNVSISSCIGGVNCYDG